MSIKEPRQLYSIPETIALGEALLSSAALPTAAHEQNPSVNLGKQGIIARFTDEIAAKKLFSFEHQAYVHDGIRFFPVPVAARVGNATPSSIFNWIAKRTEFDGQPLDLMHFKPPINKWYLSEASIKRIANRFIKWPSEDLAYDVTIGKTPERTGYLTMSDAAAIIGASRNTVRQWCQQRTAPTDKQLDVIKCKVSGYVYIHQQDAELLAEIIARNGLQRGPRPHIEGNQPAPKQRLILQP